MSPAFLASNPIISLGGYPPNLPDRLYPAIGYKLSDLCSENSPGQPYTELLIGLTPATTKGGGWLGINVRYEDDGHQRITTLPYNVFSCGPAVIEYADKDC